MSLTRSTVAAIALSLLTITQLGCEKVPEELESSSFTAADLVGAWTSDCIASTDPLSTGTYHQITVTLNSNGSFNASDLWSTSSSCASSFVASYSVVGTFTLGDIVSGSSKALNFQLTDSDIMPLVNQVQDDMNSDCAGSPFAAGGYESLGSHYSTFMTSCTSIDLPNSSDDEIENFVSFDGTTLTLGSPEFGIPGVFAGSSLPSTTISLH